MNDIEGKAAREAVSKCGQRASFNLAEVQLVNPLQSETRSLPALSRSYPRHFTFYVAHPIRSIQRR